MRSARDSLVLPRSRPRCSHQNVAKIIEGMPETEAGADNLHYVQGIVDHACELFRENKLEQFETLTNEIRDEISKTIILNDETWEGLRCRICPSCASLLGDSASTLVPMTRGTTINPMCQVTPDENAAEQEEGDETEMIPKTTTWTRKDTHLVTCPKKKTVVGSTATMTWHHGILSIPSGWRSAWMSHGRLNTWRDSSHCRCQRCEESSRVGKRERSMPLSKGSTLAHTTTTSGSTPT